jgi:hypothetical protein
VLLEFKNPGYCEDLEALLEKGLGLADEHQYALEFKFKGMNCCLLGAIYFGFPDFSVDR